MGRKDYIRAISKIKENDNYIDITYDFFEDYLNGVDPDKYNFKLKHWHKILWEKPLPYKNNVLTLEKHEYGLTHVSDLGEFYFTSDAIIHTYSRHSNYSFIINEIPRNEINTFLKVASQIGAYIIFPGNVVNKKQTINSARGFHPRIYDRFDLTLECIRLYYSGIITKVENPLGEVLLRYDDFFKLFSDFKGYCDFFLLQDLTKESFTKINFFIPFNGFSTKPRPSSVDEYKVYMENSINFIRKRNNRIIEYNKMKLK